MAHSILDVKSRRSRDLLRGLLARELDAAQVHSTLSRLVSQVDVEDIKAIDALLRDSPLFRHLEVLPEFPLTAPFQNQPSVSIVPRNGIVEYVAHRIEKNAPQIAAALDRFGDLNNALADSDDLRIVEAIAEVVAESGHSLTLARKMAWVIGYAPKDTHSYRRCAEIVAMYGLNERNHAVVATIDTIGSEFNYLDLRYRFQGFISTDLNAGVARKVSYLSFFPIAPRETDFRAVLNASYDVSIVDAAFSMFAHRALGFADAQHEFSQDLEDAWRRLCQGVERCSGLFVPRDVTSDFQAFRAAPAFLEFERLREMRFALQSIYDLPEWRRLYAGPRAQQAKFFSTATSLEDIVANEPLRLESIPSRFDRNTAAELVRTSALLWACEKGADFARMTAGPMASLMGGTTGVDRLLLPDTLRRSARSASDPFVKLILLTLLRAHSEATKDSYAFKEYFQRYVLQNHQGDILEFLKSVSALDANIVPYFVGLLDETVLSQMPFLITSSNAVYETRASMLEWHAEVHRDSITAQKAKQLRIDRKIAEVRGVLNETRLNIDAIRFRQWIEQNKLTEFSDFIRQPTASLPPLQDWSEKSKQQSMLMAAHREPATRALLAILECYAEFCKNPDYGVASFLGRRIRHGTLRGTLLDGIDKPAQVPPSVALQYQNWTREFSTQINAFAARLHFKDKAGPKGGLISAEIDTLQKRQQCLVCLKQIFDEAQHDQGILRVPFIIEQFCWFIFELELASVQASIAEARTHWGVVKLRYQSNDADATSFEKSTNILLNDRFNTVSSWFRKPPNLSPVAELGHVLKVVLKEARGEYANFDPAVKFEGDEELQLSGRIYYNVYDALAIAVRNAAKHGPHPGRLTVSATVHQADAGSTLELLVGSDLKSGDNIESALKRLEDASRTGADGADVVENRSGIRKLKKMQAERNILGFSIGAENGDAGRICVTLRFPHGGFAE